MSAAMDPDAVRQIRKFNRTVAERIGAVSDRFLQQRRPMNEARLIWEIGLAGEELRTLRMRLGLDSGYLTRVMGSLARQGLVRVRLAKEDGRVRIAQLTRSGLRARAQIDGRSDELALEILDVLTEKQREQLTSAMGQVERLLEASMIQLATEDPTSADAMWCFEQYRAEEKSRFEAGFDPTRLTPPHGALVMARLRGQAVGCGAVRFAKKGVAALKRMWVSPAFRGLGVDRRILNEMERLASGARSARLPARKKLTKSATQHSSGGRKS